MTVGIKSYGAYIPIYRISLETLSQVWGRALGQGERAIANWDEDSLTIGVEAATDCLRDISHKKIDGLYYASTTPVYMVKQTASIIAKVLDLSRDIFTADFSHSLIL